MRNKIIATYLFVILLLQVLFVGVVSATDDPLIVNQKSSASGGVVELPNPLGETKTFQALIGKIIQGGLGVVGSLTLLMFVYGGFLWLTSQGNQKKIDQGRDILVWSSIGLAIIFSSYALVKFVIQSIGG